MRSEPAISTKEGAGAMVERSSKKKRLGKNSKNREGRVYWARAQRMKNRKA